MLPEQQRPSKVSNRSWARREQSRSGPITHEMVMAVADRVYALLLQELRIERERQRFRSRLARR